MSNASLLRSVREHEAMVEQSSTRHIGSVREQLLPRRSCCACSCIKAQCFWGTEPRPVRIAKGKLPSVDTFRVAKMVVPFYSLTRSLG